MKELRLEDLTLEQKLGMTLCAHLNKGEEDVQNALALIRRHALGAVWIQPNEPGREDILRRVWEAADYPVLVMCDAEKGVGEVTIPGVISITAAGAKDEYARSFGRAVAAAHQQMGYNVVCNPVLDLCFGNGPCGSVTRSMGSDKKVVSRLGCAMAEGMHEGGVLTVCKHYPGHGSLPYDSHMRENWNDATKEQLLEENLYPYLELMKRGLADGIMTGHHLVPKVDPEHPASLSRKALSILREQGYDGFYITDALGMMGIQLKYGWTDAHGRCIHAGNSFCLSYDIPSDQAMQCIRDSYQKGLFTEAELDEAVSWILSAQRKVLALPHPDAVSPEDRENVSRINRECISARCADGCTPAIPRDGHHLFVLLTPAYQDRSSDQWPTEFLARWYRPARIREQILARFSRSEVTTIPGHPSPGDIWDLMHWQKDFDDVVFLTYFSSEPCAGREHLTIPFVDLMDALQSADRIAAHLHFGNPFVAADAPFVPRVILGFDSAKCIEEALNVLCGDLEPAGQVPYEIPFHEKGHIFR